MFGREQGVQSRGYPNSKCCRRNYVLCLCLHLCLSLSCKCNRPYITEASMTRWAKFNMVLSRCLVRKMDCSRHCAAQHRTMLSSKYPPMYVWAWKSLLPALPTYQGNVDMNSLNVPESQYHLGAALNKWGMDSNIQMCSHLWGVINLRHIYGTTFKSWPKVISLVHPAVPCFMCIFY